MESTNQRNLDFAKLDQLPIDSSWEKVTTLSAKGNAITELTDDNCHHLRSIEKLMLYHNKIRLISPFIGKLENLTELWLSRNDLVQLPPELGLLENLVFLDLSSNQLEIFPIGIANLSKLVNLNLLRNKLRQVPPELFTLEHLKYLDLSFNQLTTVGKDIVNCCSLETLDLSHNQLVDLPQDIGHLPCLRYFNFSNNAVSLFPQSMQSASRLIRLDASSNRLESLFDAGIGFSEFNLLNLQLANNRITELPEEFWRLPCLGVLNLTANLLGTKPLVARFNLPKSLTRLYLSSNRLQGFPTDIAELNNLVELYACNNFITCVSHYPAWPELEILNVNYNLIPCWPLPLPPKLKELSLIHNQIRTLPATQLVGTSLKRVWVGDNPLSKKRFTGMQTRLKSKTQVDLFEKLPDLDICSPRAKRMLIENIV